MSPGRLPGLFPKADEGRETESEAAGFVLAGGQSTRMGTDKALVEFEGRPLIAHALAILAAGLLPSRVPQVPSVGTWEGTRNYGPVFIAGARPESAAHLEAFAPVIPDIEPGLGPLAGVCSALASSTAVFGVFLPVDAPLMPASLIACLLWHARFTDAPVTLAAVNGVPQTFPAVLNRRTLPLLQRELREDRLGCFAAFQAAARELAEPPSILNAEVLAQCGQVSHPDALPVASWFLNLNTLRDLTAAASRRRSRVS